MTETPFYYVECPLRNSCILLKNGYCGGCEGCQAPSAFIKGGDNECDLCNECLIDELET